MAPPLAKMQSAIEVEVPMFDGTVNADTPVHDWSAQQVAQWLQVADGGRFGHVVLPPGLDGAGLLRLGVLRLSQLFEGSLREGRGEGEGAAWNLDTLNRADSIGRQLFDALRAEQLRHAPPGTKI